MTKSGLINQIVNASQDSGKIDSRSVIESGVKVIIDSIICSLVKGQRIEIRGFGSFDLNDRPARTGRNPKTGEKVEISAKKVPHFKPGKELREKVNQSVPNN